jgi:hypothetical protein
MDFFFVIERYAQLLNTDVLDSFSSHEAFGASLWSSKKSPTLEAIPTGHVISHAISRPWVKGVILFKALNRVSSILCSSHFRIAHTSQGFLAPHCIS